MRKINSILVTAFGAGLLCALSSSCGKQTQQLDQGWSAPSAIAQTKESLVGGLNLYLWVSNLVAIQEREDLTAYLLLTASNGQSWQRTTPLGRRPGYLWAYPTIDQQSDTLLFEHGYMYADQLVMKVLIDRTSDFAAMQNAVEKEWRINARQLFNKQALNISLSEQAGETNWPGLGPGVIAGSEFLVPFAIQGFTLDRSGVAISRGPYSGGVFHSADSGNSWQVERISNFETFGPFLCNSKNYYYYFVTRVVQEKGRQLWFSRRSITEGPWEELTVATKTVANAFVAVPQNDTVHLIWLDRRHEKTRLNPVYPDRGNFEVAYCQRKDADTKWSKDIILSEGLLYSFSPSISTENERIVVAWSGTERAPDWHTDTGPNDIYYATSKNSGRTWSKPLKVTDGAKDGITSGIPQVVLLNGTIHLLYAQGKTSFKQISTGLIMLNQPPWPIYYAKRPFPN